MSIKSLFKSLCEAVIKKCKAEIASLISDKVTAAQASDAPMPSNQAVNFSGTSYTAPAAGYVMVSGSASSGAGWFNLVSEKVQSFTVAPFSGNGLTCFIPVKKGGNVQIKSGAMANIVATFIYAVGGLKPL